MSDFSWSILIESIKNFAASYKDVINSPIITIPSTALAISLATFISKKYDEKKERKETARLFVNTVNSHIRDLSEIYFYVSSGHKQNQKTIEESQAKFEDDELYKTALKKIGIYSYTEINLISQYESSLKEALNNIKKLFLAVDNVQESRRLPIAIISLSTAIIEGLVVELFFSSSYSNQKYHRIRKKYIKDYYRIVNDLKEQFNYDQNLYTLSNIICDDLINRLEYARKIYKQVNGRYKINWDLSRDSIYICKASLTQSITTLDTSIQHPIVIFDKKNNVVVFGKSKQESKTNCKSYFKNFLDNSNTQLIQNYPSSIQLTQDEIDNLIEQARYKTYIVSP